MALAESSIGMSLGLLPSWVRSVVILEFTSASACFLDKPGGAVAARTAIESDNEVIITGPVSTQSSHVAKDGSRAPGLFACGGAGQAVRSGNVAKVSTPDQTSQHVCFQREAVTKEFSRSGIGKPAHKV
jgi:hypothetical protein